MIIGDPYKAAFLIERIPEWEKDRWKNGIMFVIINGEMYPKEVRTTTFNSELPSLLAANSAFADPISDRSLYNKTASEILEYISDDENENYYRYFIPFHEIENSGYRFYILSDGSSIKILICEFIDGEFILKDKTELSMREYEDIKSKLIGFYTECEF